MTEAYSSLLSPLRVGGIELRNRVVFGPHGTGFGSNGTVNDRHIAYHLERARGGVGLIIMEATGVDRSPTGVTTAGRNINASTDDIIPSYRRISEAMHAEGVAIFTLLSHSGRNTVMGADGTPPKAPSPISMERTRDIPHALEIYEIKELVQNFASAARRCRDGGLDGVGLSFAHGNMVQQFLSPQANKRTDEYGGSEENRLRLAREVLTACREAVGSDYILGIRFSADEIVPGGYTIEDGVRYARLFAEWGKLNYIDVTAGDNASMRSRSYHYPTISFPHAPLVPLARAVRQVLDIPVFTVGKIGNAEEADDIVARGDADAVLMIRAQIAEPEIVAKITSGRHDDIRECIYCNESCFGRQQRFGDISCVYNPRSGREAMWPPLAVQEDRRKVIVIGGGPAGMEAARTAARRGHHVELHERTAALGGQVRLLQRTPYRDVYGKIADWLEKHVHSAGVEVHLESALSAEDILARNADAVVIATGAADALPDVPGVDLPHVLTGRQVLAGADVTGRVVLGDWDGKFMGTSVAERLAEAGCEIDLVSHAFFIGADGDLMTWRAQYERLLNLGVRMHALENISAITPEGAMVRDMAGRERLLPADKVVLCTRGAAERPLFSALHGRVAGLHAIGDCWAPRQLEQAIFEGARVGRSV